MIHTYTLENCYHVSRLVLLYPGVSTDRTIMSNKSHFYISDTSAWGSKVCYFENYKYIYECSLSDVLKRSQERL